MDTSVFCMYICTLEEGTVFNGTTPPCGYWELNLGPVEEQLMLLTTVPSL